MFCFVLFPVHSVTYLHCAQAVNSNNVISEVVQIQVTILNYAWPASTGKVQAQH